jgi:hypothetical protein
LLGAVIAAGCWMGCGADNGDPTDDDPTVPTSTTPTSKPDPTTPGDFEADFPDAGDDDASIDPTPDGGDTCIDNGDPGSAENAAKTLPDTDDSQNTAIDVTGVLSSSVDVDFYSLNASDTFGHELQPAFAIATPGTEMCVFVNCLSGTTNFDSCSSGVAATSGGGFPGCCAAGPGQPIPSWTCGGFTQSDDSAQLFIRIRQTAEACTSYSFSYAF